MSLKLLRNKKVVYVMMTALVVLWGLDFIAAKAAMKTVAPLTLVFLKYFIAFVILFFIRCAMEKKFPLQRNDVVVLVGCSVFGQLLYNASEYTALSYLPISIITIVLTFVPLLSITLETIITKKLPDLLIIIGILFSILGVIMVIGFDVGELRSGKWFGYILAFGAVICWNIYNFLTKKLSGKYKIFDLTFMQIACSMLLLLPYAIFNLPDPHQLSASVIVGVLYLGIINTCIGFPIYVLGISILGPTPCALFSNFLPITAAFFGWVFLGETLSLLQLWGGAVVIAASTAVIHRKGRIDCDELAEKLIN